MRLLRVLAAALLATVAVSGISVPAHAQTGYTPSGADVEFVGTDVAFEIPSGERLECTQFDLSGNVINSGVNRAFHVDGLLLDDLASSGCTNPIAGPTVVQPTGAWTVAVTGPESGTVSPVNLRGVQVDVIALSGACTFSVIGDLDGTFNDATQVFEPTASSLEVAPGPTGPRCGLLGVAAGEPLTIDTAAFWTNAGTAVYIDGGYTPTGADVEFVGSEVAFQTPSGQRIECVQFDMLGHVANSGVNRAFGADGLILDDLVISGCTNPIFGPLVLQPTAVWTVAVRGPEVGSVSPVNLRDVQFDVIGLSGACTFSVAGGLDGTFDEGTQVLEPTDLDLEIVSTAGPLCGLMGWLPGEPLSIDAATHWTNVGTPISITNP